MRSDSDVGIRSGLKGWIFSDREKWTQNKHKKTFRTAVHLTAKLDPLPAASPSQALIVLQHQLELLNALASNFATNEYRLLIIDSIMNCFRVDFCGRGELADRQQKLNQFLSKLTHMAEGSSQSLLFSPILIALLKEFNVCVLMVHHYSRRKPPRQY